MTDYGAFSRFRASHRAAARLARSGFNRGQGVVKVTLATILALVALELTIGHERTFWFALGGLVVAILALWEAGGKVSRDG